MSILSSHAVTVKADRPNYPIKGSAFHAELAGFLLNLGYGTAQRHEVVDFLEEHGTATGCPSLDEEDRPTVNAMFMRYADLIESDPASWPSVYDETVFNLTDLDGPPPTDPEPVNVSPEDQSWWATEMGRFDALPLGLDAHALPPVRGGSPDERPVKVSPERSRSIRGEYSDEDMANVGAV
jgi:hypothetical protein